MPPDERDTGNDEEGAERDEPADEAASDQPRDPETGKFLPKDERPLDTPTAAAPDSDSDSASADDEPAAGTPSGGAAATSERDGDAPADALAVAEPAADQPRTPRPTTGRRTVFVPNPAGYPRPPAVYLPALPWLRLPARPPVGGPVTRQR